MLYKQLSSPVIIVEMYWGWCGDVLSGVSSPAGDHKCRQQSANAVSSRSWHSWRRGGESVQSGVVLSWVVLWRVLRCRVGRCYQECCGAVQSGTVLCRVGQCCELWCGAEWGGAVLQRALSCLRVFNAMAFFILVDSLLKLISNNWNFSSLRHC